jgi:hypothetical protein
LVFKAFRTIILGWLKYCYRIPASTVSAGFGTQFPPVGRPIENLSARPEFIPSIEIYAAI